VDVKFFIEQDAITIYVRDRGDGFETALLPDPLDPENLLKPTGRGVFCMRRSWTKLSIPRALRAAVSCESRSISPQSKNKLRRTAKARVGIATAI